MIHITSRDNDVILGYIAKGEFWDDWHEKSLKDTLETYEFVTLADQKFSEYLTDKNRIIIPDEDGKFIEFVIDGTKKYRDSDGALLMDVYTTASYLELQKAKVVYPQVLSGQTAKTLAMMAVDNTEWEIGDIAYAGTMGFTIDDYTNPYALLKQIASEFDLELQFRVETNGHKVTHRYVDLVERVGDWHGREIELGKDLVGIERNEDTSQIVTALVVLGPERENGTRPEVFVEDRDALQRWGRNGHHIVEVYEPQTENQDVTEELLTKLGEMELKKRINSVVTYTGQVTDLEKVPGMGNKKIRFGDTLRVKDTGFNPPLYVDARVHTQRRSLSDESLKEVTLGDFTEYSEEDVFALWQSLQSQIMDRMSKLVTVSIVSSTGTVFKNGTGSAELTAVAYKNGTEVDELGSKYDYQWDRYGKDGVYEGTRYGKTYTVLAEDIDERAVVIVTVSENGKALSSATTTLVNVNDGAQGPQGERGIQGPPGVDGKTPYIHFAYADSADGMTNFSLTDPNRAYIGTYVDYTQEDSTDPTKYTWSKIVGPQGPQGIQGPPGPDGQTLYTWVKYADSPTSGMSDSPAGKAYIGLAYNKTTATESNNYSDYSWSKIVGDQGPQGPKGADGQTLYTWIKYADDDQGNGMSDDPTGKRYLGIAYNKTTPTESTNPADYQWSPLYDNVQVGGRNLIKNSDFSNGTIGFVMFRPPSFDGTVSFEDGVIKLTSASTVMGGIYIHPDYRPQTLEGQVYTVTVWAKGFGTMRIGQEVVSGGLANVTINSDDYMPYSHTFTPNITSTYAFRFYVSSPTDGIYVDRVKLELGNVATDWTPAPEDVEAAIDQAKQDAQNAQDTADGKNTVFYQTDMPSTVGRKTNDLWFDTDDGYTMYRFDGTSWIKSQFGNNAIAELDAGKINTGYLNAGRIATDSIEAKHIKSLNGLNVGNGKFVIDSSGNVTFGGSLDGASGTFAGNLTANDLLIGDENSNDFGGVMLRMKIPERVTDGVYTWGGDFMISTSPPENVTFSVVNASNFVSFLFDGDVDINGDLWFPHGTERKIRFGLGSILRGSTSGSLFISSGNYLDQTIYLRPNGDTSTSYQFIIGNNNLTYNGGKVWHEGNDGYGSGLDADKLDGLHASSFLQTSDIGGWVNLTLENNFSRYSNDAPLSVMKDAQGFVHIRGNVGGGPWNSRITVLPYGYRPAYTKRFAVNLNGASGEVGQVTINPAGEVYIWSKITGTLSFVGLDNIMFKEGS